MFNEIDVMLEAASRVWPPVAVGGQEPPILKDEQTMDENQSAVSSTAFDNRRTHESLPAARARLTGTATISLVSCVQRFDWVIWLPDHNLSIVSPRSGPPLLTSAVLAGLAAIRAAEAIHVTIVRAETYGLSDEERLMVWRLFGESDAAAQKREG